MQCPNTTGLGVAPSLGTSVRVRPFRFDGSLSINVRLVRWPEEASLREELAALGVARILILDRGPPPTPWEDIEDWVRTPVAQAELELRATTVARRAHSRERPWLDTDGLLWFADRRTVVLRGLGPVIEALAAHFGRVVHDDEIQRAFEKSANSTHPEAVKMSMRRVSKLVGPLGLALKRVRGSGYLLERQD